ncbi:MAG: CPBP family intramembrane metalloprotease [Ruminococcus sp.]|nr:CPBP family intramembrane metalloprotease [Ruminococcus sp.]
MSKVVKYLVFTFASACVIEFIGAHDFNTGTAAGKMSFGHALIWAMLMPMFGALFAGARIRDMGWKPELRENRKNRRLLAFAWLSPTVFQILGAALYFMVFQDDFEISGDFLRDIDCDAFEECRENGSSYWGYVWREIFYSVTSFYTFLSVIPALGEEIGWRGFLYPELKKRFGRTRGVLLGGVIHGAWHFPLMLLVGYEYGRDYIGAPLLGLFAFCVFTVSTGIISDRLYESSGSIWLPAVFHGTVNAQFNPCMVRGGEHLERSVFGPNTVGLIAVIPTALFAAGIIYLEYRKEAEEQP